MPRIIVQADAQDGSKPAVLMAERVNASDFESGHFSGQLVERIGWAVFDAVAAEDDSRDPTAKAAATPEAPAASPRAARRRAGRQRQLTSV